MNDKVWILLKLTSPGAVQIIGVYTNPDSAHKEKEMRKANQVWDEDRADFVIEPHRLNNKSSASYA